MLYPVNEISGLNIVISCQNHLLQLLFSSHLVHSELLPLCPPYATKERRSTCYFIMHVIKVKFINGHKKFHQVHI